MTNHSPPPTVERIELFDEQHRALTMWGVNVTTELCDNGRTLKIFTTPRRKDTQ